MSWSHATGIGCLLSLAACAAAAPPAPRLVTGCVDPTGFKDPAAVVLPPGWCDAASSTTLALFGDYGHRRIRGFELNVASATLVREVAIDLPALEPDRVRWAPMAALDGETLWLASTRGRVDAGGIDWPSFQVVLARCDRGDASPGRLMFRDERVVALPVPPELADMAARRGLAFIDPELVRGPAGDWWLYYVVVADGVAGVRPHQEWIRRCTFETGDDLSKSRNDTLIEAGNAGSLHDGVVEAPAVSPRLMRSSQVMISSGPSDGGQRIGLITEGRAGVRWLVSTRPQDAAWRLADEEWERDGVGGQALVEIDGAAWLIYQGLGTLKGGTGRRAFRPALLDVTQALLPAPREPHDGDATNAQGLHPD